ncbi:hypothetical protein V6N11_036170 [Hibiscus sabdariffa]|uniref:Uncharacterized protein n=1 Tax=Hibiscus sabdariffa TaxID=183260 RepID=A0ABR2R9J9_9ROSI
MREAETLVIMFGGAWVVDRRIQVNIAKYSCRSSYWRKKHPQDVSRAAVHQNVRTIFNGPVDKIVEKGGCSFAGTVENKLITNLNPDDKAGIDSDVETEPFSKKHKALYEEVQGEKDDRKIVSETGESSSESTTMSAQIEKTVSSGDNPIGIDEALNVVCMGKSFHDYESTQNKDKSRSLGEPDLVGCRPEAHSVDSVSTHSSNSVLGDDLVRNKSKNIPNKDVGPKWVDVVNGIEKSMLPTDPNVNNPCYQQALEDSNSIGCQENEPVNIVNVDKVTGREECENPIQKSLVQKEKAQEQMGGILPASKVIKAVEWAKLSERNLPDLGHRDEERGTLVLPELQQKTNPVESSGFIAGESVELCGRKLTFMDHQEVESCSFDLPEFQQKSKPARVKRYGSLQHFQYKDLSAAEKKKLERYRKRKKKGLKFPEQSEIEGRSLSDSDLKTRWENGIKEAKETLEVGKKVGIEFIGDEQEIILDLVNLELGNHPNQN